MSVEMVAFFAAGNIAVSQPSLALLKINSELKNMWSNWSDPKRSKTRFSQKPLIDVCVVYFTK
ncbi:hypothetical protein ACI3LZ_004176 [Candidozyma auris]